MDPPPHSGGRDRRRRWRGRPRGSLWLRCVVRGSSLRARRLTMKAWVGWTTVWATGFTHTATLTFALSQEPPRRHGEVRARRASLEPRSTFQLQGGIISGDVNGRKAIAIALRQPSLHAVFGGVVLTPSQPPPFRWRSSSRASPMPATREPSRLRLPLKGGGSRRGSQRRRRARPSGSMHQSSAAAGVVSPYLAAQRPASK